MRLIVQVCFSLMWVSANAVSGAGDLPWESGAGHRRAKLKVPAIGKTGFTLMSGAATGIQWTNRIPTERYTERQNMMNGSGLALGDFDGDGWSDLYCCNKEGPNALYHNLGNWKFENVTERAGVSCTNQSSTGATFADINGDGRLDLLVSSFAGPDACFLNLGNGRFTNITAAAGIVSKGGTTSLALGDIDGDGDLDLYVCHFGMEAILRDGGTYAIRTVNGKPVVTGRYAKRLAIVGDRIIEFGEPSVLYRNDGQGRFTPLEWKETFRDEKGQPTAPPPDFGLAVQIRDINADGYPDIYVCNDFQTPDRLWLNDGRGRFQAPESVALRNMSYASMGVDFADIDRDGWLDFITIEMLSRDHARHLNQLSPMNPVPRTPGSILDREEVTRNALYRNRGDHTYAEIAWFSGVAATDWSWTPIFVDVDLDGFEDLLISNGHMHDVNDRDVKEARDAESTGRPRIDRKVVLRYPRLEPPKAAFRNRGDLTFEDAADAWGFNSRQIGHGMAVADLDNDGDLDVVANCENALPLIYRNESPAPRLAVRLKGRAPNTQGIGAKITLLGGPVTQAQEILCGGRYLSGDDPMRVFAAGSITNRLRIEVTWRDGKKSVVNDVRANCLYEVDEAGAVADVGAGEAANRGVGESEKKGLDARLTPANRRSTGAPTLFEDKSDLLNHVHKDPSFDDFALQPLLPKKLSQSGPGAAWFDLDGDGHDDLILGDGRGGTVTLYRGDGKGRLSARPTPELETRLTDDATSVIGWTPAEGQRSLLIGLAGYEEPMTNTAGALRFDFSQGEINEGTPIAKSSSSSGPISVADTDGDGDLDVFLGGRMVRGRFPEPASSRLFRNERGKLSLEAKNSQPLERVGPVSGATFSDLNGDGQPDLVLACEWGPICVFTNDHGIFRPWNPGVKLENESSASNAQRSTLNARPSTLNDLTGLWTGVATGDFDGDGRLDIAAGNWGLNTHYGRTPTGPWYLYYGDLNGDGQIHLFEAYPDNALKKVVPFRDLDLVGKFMPWVRERLPSHKAYSQASMAEILGDRAARAKVLKASTLASMVFLNRGELFEARALPPEAQWTPAMGLSVGDLDGDGREDLFLSQNFFAVRTEDNRQDAGRGLFLRGNGDGRFQVIPGQTSGIQVYGEQRASALSDYDEDGRVDLVVTQNAAQTKLFRNTTAKPGLRVRLGGLKCNPNGIGALIRLVFGTRMGPARCIHAGSGYWSQDSAVAVMATPEPATGIWVRWPGGKVTTAEIPKNAHEITLDPQGNVKVGNVAAVGVK